MLLLSLIIAVATITGLSLFTSRIENTIRSEASHLLAADAQVRGSQTISNAWVDKATNEGLRHALSTSFRAMAFSEGGMQLSSIKAVDSQYPLKGELQISDQPYALGFTTNKGPQPGEAWLSSQLFSLLDLKIGDGVDIGEANFTVTQVLVSEPDNAQSAFNVAPRILIHIDDVARTQAVQTGSRIRYTLMLAGDDAKIEAYKNWITPELGNHFRWVSAEESNRGVGSALQKAKQFIYLSGSFSVLLASVAIALAARRYALKHAKQVGVLKTLGLAPNKILKLFILQLSYVGLLGISVGCLMGWFMQHILALLLQQLLPNLSAPSPSSYFLGFITGLIALAGFATPPIARLRNVSPLVVLRNIKGHAIDRPALSISIGLLAMLGLIFYYSRDFKITLFISLGTFACVLLSFLFARGFSRVLYFSSRYWRGTTKLAIANLERHWLVNASQIMLFGILFMLVMSLLVVRSSLLEKWQAQLPEDAANYFVFNIFEDEKAEIETLIQNNSPNKNPFYPMIRGRIINVSNQKVSDLSEEQDNNINYGRELNLTWTSELGADNKVEKGQWWQARQLSSEHPLLASLEEEFAEGLDIQIGDEITLSASGQEFTATVSSIRSVQWDSMNPNFFIIFNKPIPNAAAANWITSFYSPQENYEFIKTLVTRHPTVTLIPLEQSIRQIKSIMSKVGSAIEFIWVLVLSSGVLVLITSIQSTLDIRLKEGAIYRVIGASKLLIKKVLAYEFAAIGLLAGLLAVIGTELVVFALQTQLFDLDYSPNVLLWLAGPAITLILITSVGLASTRRVYRAPPMLVLRNQDA